MPDSASSSPSRTPDTDALPAPRTKVERLQGLLLPLLWPVSLVYALLMRRRRRAYALGRKEKFRPPAPCVSVGNIGWGGSGKTPMVSRLLAFALGKGLKPVVLTRGYGARPPVPVFQVRPDSPWDQAGDEPLMLARAHPGATILTDPLRKRSGAWAARELKPDCYILDDGFQHLAVERDVDLVLLTPEDLGRNWNRVIPAGPWREGKSALERASAFCIKASDRELDRLEPLVRKRLEQYGKPVFGFDLEIGGLLRLGAEPRPVPDQGGPVLLVSGVGAPGGVEQSVARFLGRTPVAHLTFGDHHAYTARDWERIKGKAGELGARQVLCTPKDAVKLESMADERLLTFAVDLVFGRAFFTDQSFRHWLDRAWNDLMNDKQ